LGSPSEGLVFNLDATRTDFPGRFKAALAFVPQGNTLTLDVTLDEPAHGLMSKLGRLPGEPPVAFALRGQGTLDSFRGGLKFQAGPTIDATGSITLDRNGAGRILTSRLSGHLGPLLPAVAAPVFAGETNLDSTTHIGDDGSVALNGLTLTSRLARLDVKGALGADKMMDFSASIRALPSNGEVTETDQGSIRSLVFDSRVNGPIKAPMSRPNSRFPAPVCRMETSTRSTPRSRPFLAPKSPIAPRPLRSRHPAGLRHRTARPSLAAAIGSNASLVLRQHGSGWSRQDRAAGRRRRRFKPAMQAMSADRLYGRATEPLRTSPLQ
jgi:translocation and assembly module TamB